jgi:CheY-like chemotaxis protein
MHKYTVMIVDDDDVDRYTLKRLLKSGGIDVPIFEESDGVAALQFLSDCDVNKELYGETYPPIIIFLDINMPRMNGIEFLSEFAKLRTKQGKYESVVLLMVTSSDNASDKEAIEQYDFVEGYITKFPSSGDELRATIENFLPA